MQIPLQQEIILDITESQTQVVYANQEDKASRLVIAHIFDQGIEFDLSGYTVTFEEHKTNDKRYTDLISQSPKGTNTVMFILNEQITYSPGRNVCDLKIQSEDGQIVHTCRFYIQVRPSALTSKEIHDSDEFYDIDAKYEELKKEIGLNSNEIASVNQPESLRNGDFWLKLL